MKKQIKDLELYEIDFLVAKADGLEAKIQNRACVIYDPFSLVCIYSPTTNPAQAWPIIERESISMIKSSTRWMARTNENNYIVVSGKTPLEAAMKYYVQSKFGDEMEI